MVSFGWIFAYLATLASAETLPTSTEQALEAHGPTASGPSPTEPPQRPLHHLFARSFSPYSTTYGTANPEECGYLNNDPSKTVSLPTWFSSRLTESVQPIYCYPGELCSGADSAFLCCSSSSVSMSNNVALTQGSNCTEWAHTKCYPYTATGFCTDSACLATATACVNPEYPECFTIGAQRGLDLSGPIFGQEQGNLTAVWCDVISTSMAVKGDWLKTYSTSVSFQANSSTSPLVQTPGSTVPFSTSQASSTSEAASASGSQASVSASASQDSKAPREWSGVVLLMTMLAVAGLALLL